ncbi:MAG: hypothetical protein ACI8XM_000835 [Haloarculaceae archaeon]|jgi:hypothetical protein
MRLPDTTEPVRGVQRVIADQFGNARQTVAAQQREFRNNLGDLWDFVGELAGAGPLHRQRLETIDTRIVVTGARGKSMAVRRLHDAFVDRDYDTYAKITGRRPLSLYNGFEYEIDRSTRVTLYENERELRKFTPQDVAIFENQGIREYTTRLVNEQYVNPQVILLTNIRDDHLDTLGRNRTQIARSIARAVPAGSHVVNGEQHPTIRRYLERELRRRDAIVTHVSIPESYESIPGSEVVFGLNEVLDAVGEPPVSESTLESWLDELRPHWTHLPGGRVYDAADVNDVQSTELIRRKLVDNTGTVIQPFVYLRADRRGRTASFVRYLDRLYERGLIEQARLAGDECSLFARQTSVPVIIHDEETETPEGVLRDALRDEWPLVLMGNSTTPFMEELIDRLRTAENE